MTKLAIIAFAILVIGLCLVVYGALHGSHM
jgi:hypothetical protein